MTLDIYIFITYQKEKKKSNHIQESLKILSRALIKCWIPKDSTSKQENLDLLCSYCTLFFLIPVVFIFYFAFHHMTQFQLPSLFGCSVLLRQILALLCLELTLSLYQNLWFLKHCGLWCICHFHILANVYWYFFYW